jgi:hypothetical protein
MNDASTPPAFSLELALVVGLPVLTLVAGALTLALAFGQGFTPMAPATPATPAPAPTALHGG